MRSTLLIQTQDVWRSLRAFDHLGACCALQSPNMGVGRTFQHQPQLEMAAAKATFWSDRHKASHCPDIPPKAAQGAQNILAGRSFLLDTALEEQVKDLDAAGFHCLS